MCLIKGAFVGEKNFDVTKMHGTTIKEISSTGSNQCSRTLYLEYFLKFITRIVDLAPLRY